MKTKVDSFPNKKYKYFHKNIVVVEERWFSFMNLSDDDTFPSALIKRAKIRINQKIKFLHDTKHRVCTIAINNGWNNHIVQIVIEECDGNFCSSGNMLSRLPNPVGLSHDQVLTNFNDHELQFYAKLFDESEEVPFEVPPGHKKFNVTRKS